MRQMGGSGLTKGGGGAQANQRPRRWLPWHHQPQSKPPKSSASFFWKRVSTTRSARRTQASIPTTRIPTHDLSPFSSTNSTPPNSLATMTSRGAPAGRRVLLPPINFLFRLLQQRTPVQIWLYEQLSIRITGVIRVSPSPGILWPMLTNTRASMSS